MKKKEKTARIDSYALSGSRTSICHHCKYNITSYILEYTEKVTKRLEEYIDNKPLSELEELICPGCGYKLEWGEPPGTSRWRI